MNEATIAKKQEEVDLLVNELKQAGSTVFVDYLGLTVKKLLIYVLDSTRKTAVCVFTKTIF